jgi:hypothetical protein
VCLGIILKKDGSGQGSTREKEEEEEEAGNADEAL